MRIALVTAIALVLIAIPVAGTASAAVKPVVINITAVNGRPVGGIKRPTVKKGVPTVIQFVAKVQGRFALELKEDSALQYVTEYRPRMSMWR